VREEGAALMGYPQFGGTSVLGGGEND